MERTYLLEGLDCANCAAEVEHAVAGLPGVESAAVNFMQRRLTLCADETAMDDVERRMLAEVARVEPDVNVSPLDGDEDDDGHDHAAPGNDHLRTQIVRVAGTIVILVAAQVIPQLSSLTSLLMHLIAYLLIGGDVLWKALRGILRGRLFDENFLMGLATVGAFFIGDYPEAVAVMLFYQVGEAFQSYAVGRSRSSIASLMDIRPDTANVRRGGELVEVAPTDVAVGDIIVVRAGERIPLDGRVTEGASLLDTSALTGESLPREVSPGSDVLSGCINQTGVLTVEVTKPFGESTVAKILDLVENAGSKKARVENFVTKFARVYTPVVVILAALLAIVPVLLGQPFQLRPALVFLVISCPCALVISIPLGFFGGIGGASRRGILVKGSNYLEALAHAETVVFDKTGTLTKGRFTVAETHPSGMEASRLLELAAHAEAYSNHPISLSIKEAYGAQVDNARVADVEELSGYGVSAVVDGAQVLAGNARLMEKFGIVFPSAEYVGTTVHVALSGVYAGCLVIADEPKADAQSAIAALKARGVKRTVMLTGDASPVAQAVAERLGLDEFHAQLLPADKVEQVERLLTQKSAKGQLVFVGDGINDAPVLARADIGVAMGGLGSDAAIEAADIVLMTDEPSRLATAIGISRRTLSIVRQNIIFALGVKLVFLALGAFGVATMWEAVFADVGVALIAVLNAMRVMNSKGIE